MSDGKLQVKSDEILVVDDHSENLKMLSAILNPDKYKVRIAQSGVQALRSVETKPPDLIILDIRMPEMDGYEVCRRLKQDKISREIPIIFISALDVPMDKVKAFEVGGVDYITKPFNSEEVIARINTHLQLRQFQKELQKFSHSLERQVDVRTAELTESREDYGRLVENLTIGIFRSTPDRDGHFLMTNPALVKILGFETTEELMETPVMELYQNAADRQLFFEKLFKNEFVRNEEIAIRNKTGLSLIVSVSARVIRGQDNKPLYVDGVVEDITDRKQTDERIEQAEQKYRIVADFTYDWEYWANFDDTLEYVSPSCERISGYHVKDFMENPSLFRDIIVPEDQGIWDQYAHDSKTDLTLREVQFRIKKKDGDIRWIEHACQPIIDHQGGLRGFRASNRDITVRKQSEEALQASQEKAEMLASKLLSAQEAERARLARELHDDISQRLAFLNIELDKLEMQNESFPVPVREKLRQIGQNLGALSSDIHMISRRLHPISLKILGLVRSIETECQSFTRLKKIPVTLDLDSTLQSPSKEISLCVYRILQECLRNIVRHSKATGVHIMLSKRNNILHFLIKDNGIGFDPASSSKKVGLGIASMTERAVLIRGNLSIESRPGKGVAVKLAVPLASRNEL